MKGPLVGPPKCPPSQLWALRGGAGPSPQKPGVVPTAAITMATNNKHPRNHSGTGSDGHVTGRHFFLAVRGVLTGEFAALGESAVVPQHSPTWSWREVGSAGRVATPHHCVHGQSIYRAHKALLLHLPLKVTSPLLPLLSTSCRDWRSENSMPQLPLLKSRFLWGKGQKGWGPAVGPKGHMLPGEGPGGATS